MDIQRKLLHACDQQQLQDKFFEVKLLDKIICTCVILIEKAKLVFNAHSSAVHENACFPIYLLTLFDLWQNHK